MYSEAYANRVMSLSDFTNQKNKKYPTKQILDKKYRDENAKYIQKPICWTE